MLCMFSRRGRDGGRDAQVDGERKILFLADDTATYEYGTLKQYDNVRLPVLNNVWVKRLLELFSARVEIMNRIPQIGGQVVLKGKNLTDMKAIEREIATIAYRLEGNGGAPSFSVR